MQADLTVCYINLDAAQQRRRELEESFAKFKPSWLSCDLVRLPAVKTDDARVMQLIPRLSNCTDKEIACMLSHYDALVRHNHSKSYLWIVEDDVKFLPASFNVVANFIQECNNDDWDVLFTAVDVQQPLNIIQLFLNKLHVAEGTVSMVDLKTFPFASASSYLINPKKIDKVLGVLHPGGLGRQWDLCISDAVDRGQLKAVAFLPFITDLSDEALTSQIQSFQDQSAELLYYVFRKLMLFDADIAQIKPLVDRIDSEYLDEQAVCISKVVAGFLTQKLTLK